MEKSGNELIADFMGYKRSEEKIKYIGKMVGYTIDNEFWGLNELEFHTSWNLFMPAYEKFRLLDFSDSKLNDEHSWYCTLIGAHILEADITKANKKLVEAIKWFNTQAPQGK